MMNYNPLYCQNQFMKMGYTTWRWGWH